MAKSPLWLLAAALAPGEASAAPAEPPARELGSYQLAYPFPSPDGVALVFQGNFDGRWQLYRMKLDGGSVERLHVSSRDDTHPAYAPDGSAIAFISNRDGNDEVYLLDLASGAVRSIAPHPGKDGHPKWSHDGRWILFNRTFDPTDRDGDVASAILRVRPDGSGLEVVSDSERIETFPSLAPDGGRVALVEWFPDRAGRPARNGEIVVVDLANGRRRNLTNSEAFDGFPYWGADDWIYFSTLLEVRPGAREGVVHRIRPNGSGLERLTEVDGTSDIRPIPDAPGARLFFNRMAGGRASVWQLAIAPAAPPPAE